MTYTQDVKFIIDRLNEKGYEAYIVGGCVRDTLLGLLPKDYDICTSALPEQVKGCFEGHHIIETGIKHGTVTLMLCQTPYEITTFRTDGYYSDGRRPDEVKFVTSLRADLKRRDFTINSMAYSHKTGLVDYFEGQKHIEKRLLCAVGESDVRFSEDALRIMRGIRFASTYGFEIENSTAQSMMKNKHLLKNIAGERINVELTKLLMGRDAERVMLRFAEILAVIIPELADMFGFEQHSPYHKYDVWTHTAKAVAASYNTPVVRLALLFHDIGKPQTFSMDEQGVGHFYGHAHVGCELAKTALTRLKYDNKTIDAVLKLIKYHDSVIIPDKKSVKRRMNKLGVEGLISLMHVKRGDDLAKGDTAPTKRLTSYDEIIELCEQIMAEGECFSLKSLNIDGDDLIELGYAQGKEIGEVLRHILEEVLEGNLPNDREVLIGYGKQRIDAENR